MAIVRDYVRPLPAPPTTEPAHEPHDPVPRRSLLAGRLLQQAESWLAPTKYRSAESALS